MMRGARFEAMQNGLDRYLSEDPCKRGHTGERLTSTGTCIECRRISYEIPLGLLKIEQKELKNGFI